MPGSQPRRAVALTAARGEPGLSRVLPVPTERGSKHDIRVVDTNYDEYALVATQISKGTSSSTMVLLYSTSAAERPWCPPHRRPGAPRERLSGASLPLPSRRDPCDGVAGWGSPCGGTRPLLGCRSPGAA